MTRFQVSSDDREPLETVEGLANPEQTGFSFKNRMSACLRLPWVWNTQPCVPRLNSRARLHPRRRQSQPAIAARENVGFGPQRVSLSCSQQALDRCSRVLLPPIAVSLPRSRYSPTQVVSCQLLFLQPSATFKDLSLEWRDARFSCITFRFGTWGALGGR